MQQEPKQLTLSAVRDAVASNAAAFRLTLKLDAVSPKVFPPTYEGGKYATEDRIIGGQKLPCVLLDSVPSQANRMELALQDAAEGGLIELPLVSVDFAAVKNPAVPKVTSLQAPHRIVDAILRDSRVCTARHQRDFETPKLARNSIGSPPRMPPHCSPMRPTALYSAFGTAPDRAVGWE